MIRPTLAIGDPRDPLARALLHQLPSPLMFVSARSFPASFKVAADGTVQGGIFVVNGRMYDWHSVAALLIRPGRIWSMPLRFKFMAEGMVFHERRTAWCALLAAFPGVVLNRLPPAWFLDPALYGANLAHSLADRLRPERIWPLKRASVESGAAIMLGDQVIPAEAQHVSDRDFARWLLAQGSSLARWQLEADVRVAHIRARRGSDSWVVEAINPVPTLAGVDPKILDAHCSSLVALLT